MGTNAFDPARRDEWTARRKTLSFSKELSFAFKPLLLLKMLSTILLVLLKLYE